METNRFLFCDYSSRLIRADNDGPVQKPVFRAYAFFHRAEPRGQTQNVAAADIGGFPSLVRPGTTQNRIGPRAGVKLGVSIPSII